MRKIILCLLACSLSLSAVAQTNAKPQFEFSLKGEDLRPQINNQIRPNAVRQGMQVFDESLAPFYHGVASGDPLPNSVILWTRVTTDQPSVNVAWKVATDTTMTNIVAQGNFTTDASRDFTVKVEPINLQPETTYYYQFSALNTPSLIGRTRTAPANNANNDHLKFAVVSCSNYQAGYFSGYRYLSQLNDLDAVIHLGDYIYEYPEGGYGYSPEVGRGHEPANEILTLADYRTRHSFYKLDPDLRAIHQQHPFVTIWDDHESANNAYVDGAQNHDPATEGDWNDRKAAAKKAYFEWLPIRESADQNIHRTLHYGNLADLILLDTRLEGRDQQAEADTSLFGSPNRTMLGQVQREWFLNQLQAPNTQWKIVGNQVIFSPLLIQILLGVTPQAIELINDTWEGYRYERDSIASFIEHHQLQNVNFITGDIHNTFAFDVTKNPVDSTRYNPQTGAGSIATEMVTPSITSDGFSEVLGNNFAQSVLGVFQNLNPHSKKLNFKDHGYFILDVTPQKIQGDWYYVESIKTMESPLFYGNGVFSLNQENHLQATSQPAPPKEQQEIPAPALNISTATNNTPIIEDFALFAVYPNPTRSQITFTFGLTQNKPLQVALQSSNGSTIATLMTGEQTAGLYNLHFDTEKIPSGSYFLVFQSGKSQMARQIVVQH